MEIHLESKCMDLFKARSSFQCFQRRVPFVNAMLSGYCSSCFFFVFKTISKNEFSFNARFVIARDEYCIINGFQRWNNKQDKLQWMVFYRSSRQSHWNRFLRTLQTREREIYSTSRPENLNKVESSSTIFFVSRKTSSTMSREQKYFCRKTFWQINFRRIAIFKIQQQYFQLDR